MSGTAMIFHIFAICLAINVALAASGSTEVLFDVAYREGPFRRVFWDKYYLPRSRRVRSIKGGLLCYQANSLKRCSGDEQNLVPILQLDMFLPNDRQPQLRVVKNYDVTPAFAVIFAPKSCIVRRPRLKRNRVTHVNVECSEEVEVSVKKTRKVRGGVRIYLDAKWHVAIHTAQKVDYTIYMPTFTLVKGWRDHIVFDVTHVNYTLPGFRTHNTVYHIDPDKLKLYFPDRDTQKDYDKLSFPFPSTSLAQFHLAVSKEQAKWNPITTDDGVFMCPVHTDIEGANRDMFCYLETKNPPQQLKAPPPKMSRLYTPMAPPMRKPFHAPVSPPMRKPFHAPVSPKTRIGHHTVARTPMRKGIPRA